MTLLGLKNVNGFFVAIYCKVNLFCSTCTLDGKQKISSKMMNKRVVWCVVKSMLMIAQQLPINKVKRYAFLDSSSFHQFWKWSYKDLTIIYLTLQSFRCKRTLISGCPVLHWNNFQIKNIQNSESESMGKKRVPMLSTLKHMTGFQKIASGSSS